MKLNETWVLEYSPIQGCFHVEKLDKSITMNIAQAIGERPFTGYIVIFAGTKEQCHAQGESIRSSGISLVGRA